MKELFKKTLNNLVAIGIDVLMIVVNMGIILAEIYWWFIYQSIRGIKFLISKTNNNRPDWNEFVECVGKRHGKCSIAIFELREDEEEEEES